jgi:hypothetical protein
MLLRNIDLLNTQNTLENKKDLAAHADVTLKQCETALDYMETESQKKRAKTARKR